MVVREPARSHDGHARFADEGLERGRARDAREEEDGPRRDWRRGDEGAFDRSTQTRASGSSNENASAAIAREIAAGEPQEPPVPGAAKRGLGALAQGSPGKPPAVPERIRGVHHHHVEIASEREMLEPVVKDEDLRILSGGTHGERRSSAPHEDLRPGKTLLEERRFVTRLLPCRSAFHDQILASLPAVSAAQDRDPQSAIEEAPGDVDGYRRLPGSTDHHVSHRDRGNGRAHRWRPAQRRGGVVRPGGDRERQERGLEPERLVGAPEEPQAASGKRPAMSEASRALAPRTAETASRAS